ncbi:hypothetical protein H4696_007312 [Amycolatopsis lexingtonensis]|uniref:Uncharacterized protein n=1 Tax=Amycolatopsis lexingtonensis TaxID=218822 RepID=A0ABR9IB59_9PSEU|nr:hypothetical protein [Amycolatopsis lexingtonensis]MBE1500212.1 hypothetical protein [Amycolatopsis lexingtonensis]
MWNLGAGVVWRAAYVRAVRSAFATVPFYRERWALDGREDPVVVPGRTGTNGGAAPLAEAVHKLVDLVPLAGGARRPEPARGLGRVLRTARRPGPGSLVVLLGPDDLRPPTDLPKGVRGCVADPDAPSASVLREVAAVLDRGRRVLAVGDDKAIAAFTEDHRVEAVPHRELDSLDAGPYGVLHDPVLGYLGALGGCGRWHLDWPHVYARETAAGLAFTLLRQASPRFVDVVPAGGVPGEIAFCPRHGTPVVLA